VLSVEKAHKMEGLRNRELAVARAMEGLRWAEARVRLAYKGKKSRAIIIGREAAMRARLGELVKVFERLAAYREAHKEQIPLGARLVAAF